MSLTVLIVDSQVPYTRGPARQTLLALPLAGSTVLDQHIEALGNLVEKDVWVTSPFGVSAEYEAQITAATPRPVRVLALDQVAQLLAQAEPSDQLMIVQGRRWLVSGYDHSALRRAFRSYRGAIFGVAIGTDSGAARELVEQDASGRVRRVQRLYGAVSWPEVATSDIPFALVPGRSAFDILQGSLVDLRFALSWRGVLTNDLPVRSDTLDLTVESEFLAINERLTVEVTERAQTPAGFEQRYPGVLTARGSRIHPSARLIGPVIVHRGAQVGEGSTIVGPALIGEGSRIGAGATVAQAVVLPQTSVCEEETVRHCISPAVSPAAGAASDSAALGFAAEDPVIGPHSAGAGHGASATLARDRLAHFTAKRILDIVASAAALVVLSPLLLAVAVLIKLDSRGPVFFSHRRERKGGKEFPCIKFRTMVEHAHQIQRELYGENEVDGPQFKMRNDPRVTRVGRWLRAVNIDELPQLINVLLGDMSLVGPRPSPFRENQICVPWRRARLSVRPGITGLWQICRDDCRQSDFHQWIYYDVAYVRHFTFWLDMKILIATVLTLGGRCSVPLAWLLPAARQSNTYTRRAVA